MPWAEIGVSGGELRFWQQGPIVIDVTTGNKHRCSEANPRRSHAKPMRRICNPKNFDDARTKSLLSWFGAFGLAKPRVQRSADYAGYPISAIIARRIGSGSEGQAAMIVAIRNPLRPK